MDEGQILYRPELVDITRGDIHLFIDPEAPNWACLNGEGARIMRLFDGKRALGEILSETRGDRERRLLRNFVEDMTDIGFLDTAPFTRPDYPGRGECIAPDSLRELWVHITDRCNLRCRHCLVRGGEGGAEMGGEDVRSLLREARGLGARRVFFTGGEPFLRKDILQLIEYAAVELGLELVVLTNGTLFDKGLVEALAKVPRLLLQVSLDGPDPATHDAIRGEGSFEKTLAGIRLLKDHGIEPVVATTVMRENSGDLPKMGKLLTGLGVKSYHLLWVHEKGRAAENSIKGDPGLLEVMRGLREEAAARGIVVDNWEDYRARVAGKRGRKIDGCHACFEELCVDSSWDVYPCAALKGDPSFLMGNAREGLRAVWEGSPLGREFRALSVSALERCRGCALRHFCSGGCRCQAYFARKKDGSRGDLRAPDPYCETIKGMLVDSMVALARPNGMEGPAVLGAMLPTLPSCSAPPGVRPITDNFEVGLSHCACVLAPGLKDAYPGLLTWAAVMERYTRAAHTPEEELCCPTGYASEDLRDLPEEVTSISYGCGNPIALAMMEPGETVLDIGCGGGIDCFIAARRVGPNGRVIGIDMTEEMLRKARKSSIAVGERLGYYNVEFRKGHAEEVPLGDGAIDLAISNCVINLSRDKEQVFQEIHRVLREGGRICISDIVSDRPVPPEMKENGNLWSECISGALPQDDFLRAIERAGFFGLTLEKSYLWKTIGGIGFHSITVKAYR